MIHKWPVILYVLGATIWVGRRLIPSLRFLPESLRRRNPEIIKTLEQKYKIIGIWTTQYYNSQLIALLPFCVQVKTREAGLLSSINRKPSN